MINLRFSSLREKVEFEMSKSKYTYKIIIKHQTLADLIARESICVIRD